MDPTNKHLSYETAFTELQQIVTNLEEGEVNIDDLSKNIKRATILIAICKSKLTDSQEDVNKILKTLE